MNTPSIHIQSEHTSLSNIETDCLVVVCELGKKEALLSLLPDTAKQLLELSLDDENITGDKPDKLLLRRPPDMRCKRLFTVFLDTAVPSCKQAKQIKARCKAIHSMQAESVDMVFHTSLLREASNLNQPLLRTFIHQWLYTGYRFRHYQTSDEDDVPKTLGMHVSQEILSQQELSEIVDYEQALHLGMSSARDLANRAANDCTPVLLAEHAIELAQKYENVTTEVISEKQIVELGMQSYLAVNQGSKFAASMPVMRYQGSSRKKASPVVVIGKGVTFDTGGITLKKAAGMHHMIYDMGGAASVLGLMQAIAELALPINVIGILATAENAIDGDAYRPGDILTSMSGQTIEVISTDAEGRLLLCDALTYALTFKPAAIIDVATLTGAAITALGHTCSGLMSNNASLELALLKAGETSGDPAWSFPLWSEYFEALDSSSADMMNTGQNSPGMITAGCFLSRFVGSTPWAHLDVAGTAFKYGKQNTATGRPIPQLLAYFHQDS